MQQGFFFQQPNNFNMINMNLMNPMFMGNNMMQGMNAQNNYMNMIYQTGMNQMAPQFSTQPDKINIVFKTTQAVKTMVTVDPDKSLSDTLLLYLKRVNKPELFSPNSGIFFLFNANKVNIYDQTKVGELFNGLKGITTPTIIVNDVQNLIGAN